MCERHVNHLRYNLEVTHGKIDNGQNVKQFNDYDRYKIVNISRFSMHNKNNKRSN